VYYDFTVKIQDRPGQIVFKKKGPSEYVFYEYDRKYDKKRKFNIPQRAIIGKKYKGDTDTMQPNDNFLKYFPDADIPDLKIGRERSSCIRIGAFIVIRKLINDYGLADMLSLYFGPRDAGLFLDLAVYSIITECNVGQYYPDYAYNHPLMTQDMHIYNDTKVSDFLGSITADQRVGFLNDWNESRNHREKIYISYDSTNKNCQAGQIELVEKGHAKEDRGFKIFNEAIAYDTANREPLFYEIYPGSIVDVSQLRHAIEAAESYGYRNIGFILDRGYFSKDNIRHMDRCGYNFVIMVNGMESLVNELILRYRTTFEEERTCHIKKYHSYGMTVKHRLYADDEKDRYFHIYFDTGKQKNEREDVELKIDRLTSFLDGKIGSEYEPSTVINHYFEVFNDAEGRVKGYVEKPGAIKEELRLCGYFSIVTSEKMSAKDALELYKSRDTSEKLFSADKTFLGDRSVRVHTTESAEAKLFVEFVALIIRCRMYVSLKDEMDNLGSRPNYMTVPAAIRELEKIELIRGYDKTYRRECAVTKKQKTILEAFGMDENYIDMKAREISRELMSSERKLGS